MTTSESLGAKHMQNLPKLFIHNYPAICRHYQFSDIHNGTWYLEILPGNSVSEFYVQEVRNGVIVRRSANPLPFAEARKIYWTRTHRMSIEAGNESLPPPMPKIEWE